MSQNKAVRLFSSAPWPAVEALATCVGCLVQKLRRQLLIWTEAHTRSPSPQEMMFPHTDIWEENNKTPTSTKSKGALLKHCLTRQQQSSLNVYLKANLKIQTPLDLRAHKSLWLAPDLSVIVLNGFPALCSAAFTCSAMYRTQIISEGVGLRQLKLFPIICPVWIQWVTLFTI